MTNEKLVKAFTMKVNGYSIETIAKEFDVPPATLSKALSNVLSSKNTKPSVYPKLNEYMLTNGYTAKDLSNLLDENNTTLAAFLKGRTKPFNIIVKIIKLTGLTFEEIFMTETNT